MTRHECIDGAQERECSEAEVASYVADMAEELARLAAAARHENLAYMLEVVALEAKGAASLEPEDAVALSIPGRRRH
jgi:hypothetical protein